jgi:preprotein translocase subunit YajC
MQPNSLSTMLADAAQQPQGPNILLLMVPMLVLMYFLMIRPQQKRAKEQRLMLEKLKSGDKVITNAGIIGEVITVKERSVMLRSADAKFEVTKDSVVAITEPKSES